MATRRGARGKGWIKLMRVMTWVIAVFILIVFVVSGIAMIVTGDTAQDMAASGMLSGEQFTQSETTILQFTAQGGKAAGIATIVLGVFFTLVFLGMMQVSLDMAENLRRITGKLLRRESEQE